MKKVSGTEVDIIIQRQAKIEKEYQERLKFNHAIALKQAQAENPIKPRKRKKRRR